MKNFPSRFRTGERKNKLANARRISLRRYSMKRRMSRRVPSGGFDKALLDFFCGCHNVEVHFQRFKVSATEKMTKAFLKGRYEKLSFALSNRRAQKQISERAKNFAETLFNEAADEPTSAKRRIR